MARPESIAIKQERHIAETQATLVALKRLPDAFGRLSDAVKDVPELLGKVLEAVEQVQILCVALDERLASIEEKQGKPASPTPARNRPKDQES